ncbi:MAG TPA: acetyl-CoA carboxylase biotin carboxylase subunit [Candidatus Saccharimonadales bacterium]|nr:acetyl-CoA carboxylase biotin carboxylase subunit [Candidatus Saccharimonadales bacterium]
MFKKILIANRGEIALRIIWACRELGIRTVAVHSEPDTDSLHVRFADEDVCVGPARSAESYLNISSVITAAEITNAEAVHPGYGFLAESSTFAEVCKACRIKFIGPKPEVIASMGEKARARELMKEAGVPVLPGSEGSVETLEEAIQVAGKIEYPVIVKAAAGGGGKGMRIAGDEKELSRVFSVAREEARAAFGVPDVYIEKYLAAPRHIEFQVMADEHGNIVHLGERECSIQRRHQKLVEESPSPVLTPELRKRMAAAAIKAASFVNYENAGTVEFLLQDGKFYFIEMNTRIQVEHPVTEMVTGLDLVKEQLKVAAGQPLSWKQSDIVQKGHSIECRINAEDPVSFMPSPGTITSYHPPGGPGVRVDTAAHADCRISPYYDSMVAKLIVHGKTREEAISRMRRCLDVMVIQGIKTTIPLHQRIMADPAFRRGDFSTRFLERFFP